MTIKCPHCGKKNTWSEIACCKCGAPLNSHSNDSDPGQVIGSSYVPGGQPSAWTQTQSQQPSSPFPTVPQSPPTAQAYTPPQTPNPYSVPYSKPSTPPNIGTPYQPVPISPKKNNAAVVIIVIVAAILAVMLLLFLFFSNSLLKNSTYKNTYQHYDTPSYGKSTISAQDESSQDIISEERLAKMYQAEGGLQNEGLTAAMETWFGKSKSQITFDELSSIRFLWFGNSSYHPESMEWINARENLYIGISSYDRTEFKTDREFEETIFWYHQSVENSYSLEFGDVQYFTALTELQINTGSLPEEVSKALPNFQNLRALSLGKVDSVTNFIGLPGLTELSIDRLKSLNGIEQLSLKKLSLTDASVPDYTPLKGLTKLESLYLESCEGLVDLNFLCEIPQLNDLSLVDMDESTDFSPLGEMSYLKNLTVNGTEQKRMQWLQNLTELQSFQAEDNDNIRELPELEKCTKLISLKLEVSGFERMPSLSGMTQLQVLELSDVGDISSISGKTSLTDVTLHNCYGSLSSLSTLTGLQRLKMDRGTEQDLSFLASLSNLKELDLRGAEFYYLFDSIAPLTKLESLDISSGTFGGNIANLAKLTSLKRLRMDQSLLVKEATIHFNDGFTSIGYADADPAEVRNALGKLSSLTWLSLRDLNLTDISFLYNLKELRYLDITDNYITDLTPTQSLPSLETLLAADNPVIDSDTSTGNS